MPPGPDDPTDRETLARYADELVAAAEAAIPRWVDRSVRGVLTDQRIPIDALVAQRIEAAGQDAAAAGLPALRQLLETDIDQQRTNPLSILRSLVRYPTEVLRSAGAHPVARDHFAERNFPDDVYDLTPAAFADVDPGLHEPGLRWGAAKAHVHLARRRRLGER